MQKLGRRRVMQLEGLEGRALMSGVTGHWDAATDHLDVRSEHGEIAKCRKTPGAGAGRANGSAALDPPFPPRQFEVSGTNVPVNFRSSPTFSTFAPQQIANGMQLTVSAVRVPGATWVDLSFQATSAKGLAGNPNAAWQAGPIKDIKVNRTVNLTNESFYFTTNNVPPATPPKSGADFVVRANPLAKVAVPWGLQPKQVYFFKNFRPGTTFGDPLNLGSGVKFPKYAEFLKLLNVPSSVNNLHFDFEYTFPMR